MEKYLRVLSSAKTKLVAAGLWHWNGFHGRNRMDTPWECFLLQRGTQFTGVLGLDIIKNFELISLLNTSDNAIAVPPGSPFRNTKDLAEYAKKNPNKVKVSNNGTGSMCTYAR